MTPYSALALQMDCRAVNTLPDREAVDVAMQSTLARVDQLIAGSKGFISTFSGDALKLVVLPEYFLTSFLQILDNGRLLAQEVRPVRHRDFTRLVQQIVGRIEMVRGVGRAK